MREPKASRGKPAAVPRELLVLRHGKSDWDAPGGTDFDRPLAGRGRKDARRMGAWMKRDRILPDLVVSSPALRAKETTLRALEEMGLDEAAVRWEPGVYEAGLDRLLAVLAELPGSARRVLLVGHNPGLEELVLHLGGDDLVIPEDGKVMPTAALARFRMPAGWGRLAEGSGERIALVRPGDL